MPRRVRSTTRARDAARRQQVVNAALSGTVPEHLEALGRLGEMLNTEPETTTPTLNFEPLSEARQIRFNGSALPSDYVITTGTDPRPRWRASYLPDEGPPLPPEPQPAYQYVTVNPLGWLPIQDPAPTYHDGTPRGSMAQVPRKDRMGLMARDWNGACLSAFKRRVAQLLHPTELASMSSLTNFVDICIHNYFHGLVSEFDFLVEWAWQNPLGFPPRPLPRLKRKTRSENQLYPSKELALNNDSSRRESLTKNRYSRLSTYRSTHETRPWEVKPKPKFAYELAASYLALKEGMGIELEVEWTDSYQRPQILEEILDKEFKGEYFLCADGSLRNGVEIVFAPIAASYLPQNYCRFVRVLRRMKELMPDIVSHESGRCGLHIHVSSKYYQASEIWERIRKILYASCGGLFRYLSRRSNFRYCAFGIPDSNRRYEALNFSTRDLGTSEFRFWRGTIDPKVFIGSLDVTLAFLEWGKSQLPGALRQANQTHFVEWLYKAKASSRFKMARWLIERELLLDGYSRDGIMGSVMELSVMNGAVSNRYVADETTRKKLLLIRRERILPLITATRDAAINEAERQCTIDGTGYHWAPRFIKPIGPEWTKDMVRAIQLEPIIIDWPKRTPTHPSDPPTLPISARYLPELNRIEIIDS